MFSEGMELDAAAVEGVTESALVDSTVDRSDAPSPPTTFDLPPTTTTPSTTTSAPAVEASSIPEGQETSDIVTEEGDKVSEAMEEVAVVEEVKRTSPAPVLPTADELEALASKKRKLAVIADENKKRSRRMFGLLQGTLQQAKKETTSGKLGGMAKGRREVEERFEAKIRKERDEAEEKSKREREVRDTRNSIERKMAEIANADTIVSSLSFIVLPLGLYYPLTNLVFGSNVFSSEIDIQQSTILPDSSVPPSPLQPLFPPPTTSRPLIFPASHTLSTFLTRTIPNRSTGYLKDSSRHKKIK